MEASVINYLAIDVGEKRIGLATGNMLSGVAIRFKTLNHDEYILNSINKLIAELKIDQLVIGLPKNINDDDTMQTTYVRQFAKQLELNTRLPINFQDEALSSVKARTELEKTNKTFNKGDIDMLAATYFLQDFLNDKMEIKR